MQSSGGTKPARRVVTRINLYMSKRTRRSGLRVCRAMAKAIGKKGISFSAMVKSLIEERAATLPPPVKRARKTKEKNNEQRDES